MKNTSCLIVSYCKMAEPSGIDENVSIMSSSVQPHLSPTTLTEPTRVLIEKDLGSM